MDEKRGNKDRDWFYLVFVGKMSMAGTLVTPDKRKGMVMVEQGDDQLMHFKWKDRTTSTVEDDLIIFPDDVSWGKYKDVPLYIL